MPVSFVSKIVPALVGLVLSTHGVLKQVGFSKELISRGRYAELLADNRPFNEVQG
jgi:hypothetical protein